MIRAHKDAILARLREDPELAGITFEGVVSQRPAKYCTLFTNSGHRTAERLSGPSSTAEFTYTVHSVGTTADQAQFVAERVLAQLLDYVPPVAGFQCSQLRHASSQPTQRDTDVTNLYFCVDQFDMTSDPVA